MEPVITVRKAIGFLVGLVVLGVIAGLLGGFRWLEFVAVAGTAAGTLGLAFSTYDLARATRTAETQTEELVRVGHQQLGLSRDEVAAAQKTATDAARARIDATAPLLGLLVELEPITIPGVGDAGTPGATVTDGRWTMDELSDLRIHAPIEFEFVNYGRSPALVSIPSLIPDLQSLLKETAGSRQLIIPPGGRYRDVQALPSQRADGDYPDAVRNRRDVQQPDPRRYVRHFALARHVAASQAGARNGRHVQRSDPPERATTPNRAGIPEPRATRRDACGRREHPPRPRERDETSRRLDQI
jgi:hypothetical protein